MFICGVFLGRRFVRRYLLRFVRLCANLPRERARRSLKPRCMVLWNIACVFDGTVRNCSGQKKGALCLKLFMSRLISCGESPSTNGATPSMIESAYLLKKGNSTRKLLNCSATDIVTGLIYVLKLCVAIIQDCGDTPQVEVAEHHLFSKRPTIFLCMKNLCASQF